MSTLKFKPFKVNPNTNECFFPIHALIWIEKLAKLLISQSGHKFDLSDLKDGKIIKGETESLKKLQEKLDQANLPTGEIT